MWWTEQSEIRDRGVMRSDHNLLVTASKHVAICSRDAVPVVPIC
jgi:hypothetical protein